MLIIHTNSCCILCKLRRQYIIDDKQQTPEAYSTVETLEEEQINKGQVPTQLMVGKTVTGATSSNWTMDMHNQGQTINQAPILGNKDIVCLSKDMAEDSIIKEVMAIAVMDMPVIVATHTKQEEQIAQEDSINQVRLIFPCKAR